MEELKQKLSRYRERADAARFTLQHISASDAGMCRSVQVLIDSWDALTRVAEAAISKAKISGEG